MTNKKEWPLFRRWVYREATYNEKGELLTPTIYAHDPIGGGVPTLTIEPRDLIDSKVFRDGLKDDPLPE